MEPIIDLDEKGNKNLETLFTNINEGNTLLFLGAGASITDKKYLSQQLIEYYEDKIGKKYNIPNITTFVDVLETESNFDRKAFDTYVFEMLNRLSVSDAHRAIVSIPWRQIITTNYDLLIEKAFDETKDTSNYIQDIIAIKSAKEYNNLLACNEIKYVKLHGCMSDRSKYPFLFSTEDFKKAKGFYKTVLNSLKSPSHKVNFLSIGFSYADPFSYSFLEMLDSQGYRDRRWLYNVDPYVNESMLGYYASKKICIIKLTSEEFFKRYRLWEESQLNDRLKTSKKIVIKNSRNSEISISGRLANNLKYSVEQLNSTYNGSFISNKDFYLGEEPNFNVVLKNYDVIKTSMVDSVLEKLIKNLDLSKSSLIPIFLLEGGFGSGKTTMTYRVIKSLLDDSSLDLVALEIKDIENLRIPDIIELIQTVKPKYLLFYTNHLEVDSVFKGIMSIRNELSTRQISDTNIFFLVSARSNIIEKYKAKNDYRNFFEISIDKKLTDDEIDDFVTRLKNCSLLNYRDVSEKKDIIQKIKKEYDSDSFISLVRLVTNGKHIDDLRDAYFQLSENCRKAFIYTALLHRYDILMPSSLLKQIVSNDWGDFKKNIIDVEGKGILVQEEVIAKDLDPDLYFKTKHPIIADLLINQILKTSDNIYKHYKTILNYVSQNVRLSKLAVNLLKSITYKGEISNEKICKLYDSAYIGLQDEPYFLLNYCISLQYRNSKNDLNRAWDLLIYAESLLEKRNDKFIHRRAVIAFELAKMHFKEEKKELNLTLKYLSEAKELFELKQILDPCSSYSYVDYINLLIWEIEKVNNNKEDVLRLKVQVDEQFETALSSITEGTNKILDIKTRYIEKHCAQFGTNEYLKELDEMYEDISLRPYACILKYNFLTHKGNSEDICNELIEEMSNYTDNHEVSKFLFRYYSHKLNYTSYRIKFFDLIKKDNNLIDIKPLNYNYFMFVAESYSSNFSYAFNFLEDIKTKFSYINPDYQQVWKEPDSDKARLFEGIIVLNKNSFLVFKPYDLQYKFFLKKGAYYKVKQGEKVTAKLHFYLNGIRAEIVETVLKD